MNPFNTLSNHLSLLLNHSPESEDEKILIEKTIALIKEKMQIFKYPDAIWIMPPKDNEHYQVTCINYNMIYLSSQNGLSHAYTFDGKKYQKQKSKLKDESLLDVHQTQKAYYAWSNACDQELLITNIDQIIATYF